MKTQLLLKWTTMLLITATIMGCVKKEFDVPPINIPKVHFNANMSIQDLKDSLGVSVTLKEITSDWIIQGLVTANDESGNYYKTMVIQDETAGIEIKMDRSYLHNKYKRGQRVFIKCKGLYLGTYNNMIQLGYNFNNSIGRIPDAIIDEHFFLDSLPGALPEPKSISLNSIAFNDVSRLVKLESVYFELPGVELAPQTADATNRKLLDYNENFILLRTSKYADFSNAKTPYGAGTVTGILSVFGNDWQLYIRDLNDLASFDTTNMPPIETTLIEEMFDVNPPNWVIVNLAGNKTWEWSSSFKCMLVNGYGADAACDDWLISPPVNLSGVSNPILTFRTWTKFTDSGQPNPLTVFVSTDYTGSGNPNDANWTQINPTLSPVNSQQWTGSGNIDLSGFLTSNVRVGFRYVSTSSSSSSQWEVDEFKIIGTR